MGYTEGTKYSVCETVLVVPVEIPMLEKACDHAEDKLTVTEGKAATCEEAGYTDGAVCSCGEVIKAAEEIPVLGHDLADVAAAMPVPVKSTGDRTDGLVYGDGHTVHKACSRCDYTEGKTVIPGGTAHTSGSTLMLEEQIIISGFAQFKGFAGVDPVENGGLLVWETEVTEENATIETANQVHGGMNQLPNYLGMPEYEQHTDGIPANEYGKTIYLRPYLEIADGVYVYGPLKDYGVYRYCQNQLKKTTTDDKSVELRALCAEILHYGAAAQIQLDKDKVGTLVNDPSFISEIANYPASEWNAQWLMPPLRFPRALLSLRRMPTPSAPVRSCCWMVPSSCSSSSPTTTAPSRRLR